MLSPSAHPSLAQRDGCGCPPWVLRCVHWDGQILHLVDLSKHQQLCKGRKAPHGTSWSVGQGPLAHAPGHIVEGGRKGFLSNDLPAAEAEFFRRERELLGQA
jgi:hypothetical protein